MLDSVRGKLVVSENDFAVVDVNGLSFHVDIPVSTHEAMPALGTEVRLYTRLSLNTNEGSFLLFGFATQVERECFDIVTGISGIGPRKGLMILSQIEIAPFAKAIVSSDLTYLSKIKGIGKKTAERLVVELREKMGPYVKTDSTPKNLPGSANVMEAIEALIVLGCRQSVAEKAVSEAVKELGVDARTEDLVRAGLRFR
ncbi:Holliday junction branch migration protein RuvA [soil metagenome]